MAKLCLAWALITHIINIKSIPDPQRVVQKPRIYIQTTLAEILLNIVCVHNKHVFRCAIRVLWSWQNFRLSFRLKSRSIILCRMLLLFNTLISILYACSQHKFTSLKLPLGAGMASDCTGQAVSQCAYVPAKPKAICPAPTFIFLQTRNVHVGCKLSIFWFHS